MNLHENNDWRTIAHDEFEARKQFEQKLKQAATELTQLRVNLTTANNYNAALTKKLSHLETSNAHYSSKLQQCIDLLKRAKLLFKHQKKQINNLQNASINLQ